MDKNTLCVWAIKNSIVVIAWTILAILFGKWWIALFGLLFLSGLSIGHRYYRVCDKCGKHSEHADSYNEALDKAKVAGWKHCEDGNKDYCPDCQKTEICKYRMFIPNVGTCCGAYAESKRKDGKYWAHFPICTDENCPLVHPGLLEGAILENEE